MPKRKRIPIEDYPAYLKSLQEKGQHGEAGPSPVVGMGRIVDAKPERSYAKWIGAPVLALMLVMGGWFAYDAVSVHEHTIILQSQNPAQMISDIESEGAKVIAVKQTDIFAYEVKVSTRESKRSLLDRLLKRK